MEDIANNSLENIESPDEFDQPKLNKNFTFNPLEESKQKAAGIIPKLFKQPLQREMIEETEDEHLETKDINEEKDNIAVIEQRVDHPQEENKVSEVKLNRSNPFRKSPSRADIAPQNQMITIKNENKGKIFVNPFLKKP